MGSIFDEMKKVKNLRHNNKADTPLQKGSTTRTAVPSPQPNSMLKCPTCGRTFPIELLKRHLVREHAVAERTSLSDAVVMLSGGKATAKLGQKPCHVGQKPPPAPKSKKSTDRRVIKNLHPQVGVANLDRNKNLDGYVKQVLKLPSGEIHTMYVRRSRQLPPKQKSLPSATGGRTNSSAGNQSKATKPKQKTLTNRAGQPSLPPKKNPLAPPKRSFKLSGPNDFKMPDTWVEHGVKTTLWTVGNLISARMGIDFGTAFTKASIGYGDDIFIVDWAGINGGQDKFTLPGEFSELPDGTCVMGRAPDAQRVATDLKLPFLEGQASKSSLIDATIFLALVMRYIRGWWFHHHKGLVKEKAIEWNINLGAPSTPWQDSNIRSKYKKAAKAAWAMSCSSGPIAITQAERLLGHPEISAPPVEIVPEFVAQIASYTRSPQRQPDLHLLVDVGAGTVDVVTFNVHQDDQTGEDCFPIFWASVSNLGTHFLMSRRLHAFPQTSNEHWSDASAVHGAQEFAQAFDISVQDVHKTDRLHSKEVAEAITSVLRKTKFNRYPMSPNWRSGIRVFFCGGGSSCDAFDQAINDASSSFDVVLHRIRLPLPSHLKAPSLPANHFHRVSVAFGLGMDVFNLGQIRHMATVANVPSVKQRLRAHNTDFEDK